VKDKIQAIQKLREISNENTDYLAKTSALIEFNRVSANSESTISDYVEIICKDTALASAVLKASNSSIYGLTKKVSTIKQAVQVIGIQNVKNIFTTEVIRKALKPDICGEAFEQLWRHSLATAVATEVVSSFSKKKADWEEYFVAGLIHDLGKFMIYKHLYEHELSINELLSKKTNIRNLEAEREVLFVTHQEVGAFFAREWNFPASIVNCIRYHHFFELASNDKSRIAVITIGNNLAKGLLLGEYRNVYLDPVPRWVWSFLNIEMKDLSKITELVHHRFYGMLAVFE